MFERLTWRLEVAVRIGDVTGSLLRDKALRTPVRAKNLTLSRITVWVSRELGLKVGVNLQLVIFLLRFLHISSYIQDYSRLELTFLPGEKELGQRSGLPKLSDILLWLVQDPRAAYI